MRRWRGFALVFAVAAACGTAAFVTHVLAQSPAPGAGHGFLIDKHVAAGLNCASCHSESPPAKQPDAAVCSKCHGSYQDLAAKTAADQPNPHASHLGDIPCESCHRIHQASVIYCAQCHNFDFKAP
jgi:hypothetical protein